MDHERFDNIARTLSSGSSRRKVLGGALAGIFGASVASVSGLAKGKKGKAGRNKKSSKGKKSKAGAEFTCTDANNPCDNDSCCASTAGGLGPICITEGTQISGTQQFCGNLGGGDRGGGVCRTCPVGTVCSLDSDNELRCLCTPSTCPDGCCINGDNDDLDDQCVQNGSGAPVNSTDPFFDGEFVCGLGGSECTRCSLGTIFNGCCDATGACRAGTTGNNCGNSGALCEICPLGQECGVDQTCSGDPPPPPPPPPPACAAGLTECPAGSGLCVNLGTSPLNCGACGAACPACGKGRKAQCEGGDCGCSQKKRKRRKRKKN